MTGGQVVTPNGTAESLDVTVADGTIVEVEARPAAVADREIDVSGMYVAPGFIDLQLNGGWGHDFTTDPQSIGDGGAPAPEHRRDGLPADDRHRAGDRAMGSARLDRGGCRR